MGQWCSSRRPAAGRHHIRMRRMRTSNNDDTIKMVEELLGAVPDPWCKLCDEAAAYHGHAEDCPLRFIRPSVVLEGKIDADIIFKKNENRQRIFKSDKKKWSGLPGASIKTTIKKRRPRKPKQVRELRRCRVCEKRHLHSKRGRFWMCMKCEHIRPCPPRSRCRICP